MGKRPPGPPDHPRQQAWWEADAPVQAVPLRGAAHAPDNAYALDDEPRPPVGEHEVSIPAAPPSLAAGQPAASRKGRPRSERITTPPPAEAVDPPQRRAGAAHVQEAATEPEATPDPVAGSLGAAPEEAPSAAPEDVPEAAPEVEAPSAGFPVPYRFVSTGAPRRARRGSPSRGRRVRRVLLVATATASVVVLTLGLMAYRHLNGNLRQSPLFAGESGDAGKEKVDARGRSPLNILVIGSDSRASQVDCKIGGGCGGGPTLTSRSSCTCPRTGPMQQR